MSVILADSGKSKCRFWKEIESTTDYGDRQYVFDKPMYSEFKDAILQRLKSTVKTVLILFCRDGISVLKELYSGLNTFNCMCGVMIFCSNENGLVEDEISKEVANLPTKDFNIRIVSDSNKAKMQLTELQNDAKSGAFRKAREDVEVNEHSIKNPNAMKK